MLMAKMLHCYGSKLLARLENSWNFVRCLEQWWIKWVTRFVTENLGDIGAGKSDLPDNVSEFFWDFWNGSEVRKEEPVDSP
jgi:hypothetical protein